MYFLKLKKLHNWLDEFYYLLAIQIPLLLVTGIDYIVHNWLYNWGLQFDYSWAYPYWTLLSLFFISLGIVGATAYRIDRKKLSPVSKLKFFAVAITIMAEYFGGFLDSLFYLIHFLSGKTVDWTANWWWSLYSRIFGHFDLRMNLILNLITFLLLIILWTRLRKSENKN